MTRRRTAFCAAAVAGLVASTGPGTAGDVWAFPPAAPPVLGACTAPGSFSLPGTDGCLRIGGSLAAEFSGSVPAWRGALDRPGPAVGSSPGGDLTRTLAQARVYADVRVPTELGPFRAFVSIRNRHGF